MSELSLFFNTLKEKPCSYLPVYVFLTCAGGTEVDSPQNVIPPKRPDFEEEEGVPAAPALKAPISSRSRFAALAANINNWEDDTDHPKHEFHKVCWVTVIQQEI